MLKFINASFGLGILILTLVACSTQLSPKIEEPQVHESTDYSHYVDGFLIKYTKDK